MKQTIRRNVELGVLFGLICAIVLSFARFEVRCDELRDGVLRLHIIANSDSKEDQALKLAVRDEILKNSTDIFKNCDTVEDAILKADSKTDDINKIANKVLEQNGFNYEARVSVGDKYFDTREYDDFTLPAGTYKSLVVDLGDAKGKNWWCVMFPSLCLPAAEKTDIQAIKNVYSEKEENIVTGSEKYEYRFKIIEFIEKMRNKVDNRF